MGPNLKAMGHLRGEPMAGEIFGPTIGQKAKAMRQLREDIMNFGPTMGHIAKSM